MEQSSLKDKTAKGFAWGAVNNLTCQLLQAIFGIIIARSVTHEDYGVIELLSIFTVVANTLQDSGFRVSLINRKDATHTDYNSVFWFNIGVSAAMYALFFVCAPLISDFYNEPLLTSVSRYYFLAFLAASFSIVPRAILISQFRQKELAIIGLAATAISGVIGATMAINGMKYWGIATQQIMFNLCVSLFSWYYSGWRPSFAITFKPIREMFSFSSKMLLTDIIVQINNRIFSVALGKFYNKDIVGIYGQANKWNTMGTNTVNGMVQGVAQPTFVQVGDDKARLCRTFRKMLRFTCFVCFPAMFGLSLIANEFIVILVTERWLPSAHLMQMLCVAGAFLPIATLYYNLILSRGKSDIYMYNALCQGCTIIASILCMQYLVRSVDLNIFSIHVSLDTIDLMVLSYTIIIILWTLVWQTFLKREIGLTFRDAAKDIMPFLLIATATMFVTYFITRSITNLYLLITLRIILAAAIYVGSLWLLGAKILRECVRYIMPRFPFLSRWIG